jgi:hypothetical protein
MYPYIFKDGRVARLDAYKDMTHAHTTGWMRSMDTEYAILLRIVVIRNPYRTRTAYSTLTVSTCYIDTEKAVK